MSAAPDSVRGVADQRTAYLRLVGLGLLWGCSFLFIKWALEGLSPAQISLGRVLLGAAVLWPLALAQGHRPPRERRLWLHLTVMSLLSNVVPFFLFGWGQERVTTGVAGIYNALTPLTTLMIAVVVLPEERPNLERVAGFLLAIGGVSLILGGDVGGSSVSGQLACLAAAASYGGAFTYARRKLTPRGLPPVVIAVTQLTCASAVMLLLSPVVARDPVELTGRVVLSVVLLGGLGTGIAFVVYHGLIRDLGATSASMVTFLVPVVAVTLGVIVLGEQVSWKLFAGGAVVILGVALAEGRLRRRPTPEPAALTPTVVSPNAVR